MSCELKVLFKCDQVHSRLAERLFEHWDAVSIYFYYGGQRYWIHRG